MQQENNHEQRISQLEKLLESKIRQLAEVTQELDDLTFAISHDLKAPIRAIGGFSGILKEEQGEALNAEAKRLLAVIDKNAGKLTNMLNDIISYSAISKKNLVTRTVNMHQLASYSLETLLSTKEKDIFTITVKAPDTCNADESMMKQLWLNLLNMALLHAEKNSFFNIEISSGENEQQLTYSIKCNAAIVGDANADGGYNIAETINARESLEGGGTGAAFIKRVLFKHGGNFWIQSIPHRECIFNFSLPA